MEIAKKLFLQSLDTLSRIKDLELALRLYGHQKKYPPQDCNDTRLEVGFSKNNTEKIKQKIREVQPSGTTPIALSLEAAAGDFPECDNCRNIIILITDGVEECDGDPCAISLALQKKGIVLKPFVIGIGLDLDFRKSFECIGQYFDASREENFINILNIVISQALNSTTAQVNLLDIYGKPTETNVNMTFYDKHSGMVKYNYIHTINSRGLPDTVNLDPLVEYNLVVNTVPPVEKKDILLVPGKHTIIALDAPQGYLNIKVDGRSDYKKLTAIVRKNNEMQTLNVQDLNEINKYLIGKYDLEVLSLPRIKINDVEIKQSHTATVQIPQPGVVTIQNTATGYGSIYTDNGEKLEWVCNLNDLLTQETFILQPGKYQVVYRSKNSRETIYTTSKIFKVESGSSVSIKVN